MNTLPADICQLLLDPNRLKKLTNDELESQFSKMVVTERKVLRGILIYILEIERRRMYLDKSRQSCFDYLTKDFGYSNSAAMRRLNAAKLMKEIPEIGPKLDSGELNLSQLGDVSRSIKDKERAFPEPVSTEKKREILEKIQNKPVAESQQIIAEALDIIPKRPDVARSQADKSVLLNINLSLEQFIKLKDSKERAAHLLTLRSASPLWSDVIELLAENFLGKYTIPHTDISRATLRKLFSRAQACEHIDKQTGRICNSRYGIQVDHIIPKWAGGDDSLENLQLLCGNHNRRKYEKETNTERR